MADMTKTNQAARDTKRVLQIMLGSALPPPAIDMITNTVFATAKPSSFASLSSSPSNSGKLGGSSPSGTPKYALRRVDSGPLGDMALTPLTCSRSHNMAMEDGKKFQFHIAGGSMEDHATSSPRRR